MTVVRNAERPLAALTVRDGSRSGLPTRAKAVAKSRANDRANVRDLTLTRARPLLCGGRDAARR